ncbi:DUF1631 domain-containing protein [Caenimonas terrae]|uniref:DUF1631 domain-containing protein n=1 Tax=Caenimonas terrae TaxID=696074 RepID=A0ABW0N7X0_9BURK
MSEQLPPASPVPLARQAREQFVAYVEGVLTPLSDAIRLKLIELVDTGTSTRDMQDRRDAMLDFERQRARWVQATAKAWHDAVIPPTTTTRVRLGAVNLELIGDDVVEKKILSSRLALAVREKASWELNDLKVRMQHLEGTDDLASHDILQPEAVSQVLIEQWTGSELNRQSWSLVKDVIQQHMVERLLEGYKRTNKFLVDHGVLPDIDLAKKVKRGAPAPSARRGAGSQAGQAPSTDYGDEGMGGGPGGGGGGGPGGGGYGGGDSNYGAPGSAAAGGGGGGAQGGGRGGSGGYADSVPANAAQLGSRSGAAPAGGGRGGSGEASRGPGNVSEETRMMTSGTPLARARQRANGVLGQLRRLLTDRVAGFDINHETRPSPALDEALSIQQTAVQNTVAGALGGGPQAGGSAGTTASGDEIVVYDNARVEQVATELRQRTGELKKKAVTSTEKATIEIVALMFQSILAEERIPPAVRVWFARLQMPVLRVAIAEPEFFGSLSHPARQLIDRMGSCVMGFDASSIGGSALETEIKRVVQVIEQYPETGRRVFQLVYDEFQKFLSRFLTEKGPTQRLVSVAQQVEQKETMAIQYTIEMRRMLNDMPVRDEIREFLFKVWAEVLAVSAVKNGPQHEETLALKKAATDLVWAASAKPNRNDRARVIQDLPALLLKLRQGMELMAITGSEQEGHIKIIGDTLADAFLSKTAAIPQARIEAMAQRLANLEDFVGDDPNTDLPLDAESIELMLGIDASMIEVIADGGSRPSIAMVAWAQELQLGNWFTLDHNGITAQVQYVWRSDRKQLHLFASPEGRSYLLQARRMASYLQAGLLLPNEEEALTVRATRDALAKLDANPERLLG